VLAGRTVISVAQRPDVIHRSAAMVGVLHNGTLAEWYSIYLLYQYKRTETDGEGGGRGPPVSLAARRGLYYSLLQGAPVTEGGAEGGAPTSYSTLSKGSSVSESTTGGEGTKHRHRIMTLMDSFDEVFCVVCV